MIDTHRYITLRDSSHHRCENGVYETFIKFKERENLPIKILALLDIDSWKLYE